ncbi:MAG: nucleoside deaminase [Myxococcaceae bacterium]|nr:nucleoside deaminase [Myxococcaceae bacterium]
MEAALELAREAAAIGEVPVGAVAVKDGAIIGRGYNRREIDRDPLAHAELIAMREACRALDAWRLTGVTVYVTLEPCAMCAGAMVQARLTEVVFGAEDAKQGRADLLVGHNHTVKVTRGVQAEASSAMLRAFFAKLREG